MADIQGYDLDKLNPRTLRKMPDTHFRNLARQIVDLQQKSRNEFQLLFYEPVSDQAAEIHRRTERYVGVGGGNRSGKSETVLVELCMMATGVIPLWFREDPELYEIMRSKLRGPAELRVVVESLTTTLYPIILPKLRWFKWTGPDRPGGQRGHWGWIPRRCLKQGSWDKSYSEKIRTLTVSYLDPDDPTYTKVVGESTIQFMCLRGDQRVLRPDGRWTRIDEVKIGETISGSNGSCGVTNVFRYPNAPLYRIRAAGGIDITATPDHRHVLADGRLATTSELQIGDYLKTVDSSRNFGSPSMQYWALGWMAIGIGDGTFTGRQFRFSAMPNGRVMSDLPPLPPGCHLKHVRNTNDHMVTLKKRRRDNPLVVMLKGFGLWGRKSQDKFVPDAVFCENIDARCYFLHHLWNTDGTVNEDGRQAVYVSTSKRLADDVRKLLWSIGVPASHGEGTYWSELAGRPVTRYMTRVSGGSFDRFSQMVVQLAGRDAPESKIRSHGKIRSIERVDNDDAYCVEVDAPDSLFVCEGVLTHNSKDQDAEDFASGDLDACMLDEPPLLAQYRETEARVMGKNGRILLAMTWPDDPSINVDWLFDEMYEPGQPGPSKDPDKVWLNLFTLDNKTLDHEGTALKAKSWSDEIKQVRLYGQPIRFSNRVHAGFTDQPKVWCFDCQKDTVTVDKRCTNTRDGHPCKSESTVRYCHVEHRETKPGWPVIWLLDPHPRKPHMFCWVALDPYDDWHVLRTDECAGTPDDVAEQVFALENDNGWRIAKRMIDPNMGRSPAGIQRDVTWQDEFDAVGLITDLSDDSGVGHQRVDHLLRPDLNTLRPRITFEPGEATESGVLQMKRYLWDDYRRDLDKGQKQKTKDKYDDYPTLLKYLANEDPRFGTLADGAPVLRRQVRGQRPVSSSYDPRYRQLRR